MSLDTPARDRRDRRLIRLIVIGSAFGLLLAWGTLIPVMLAGPMPAHLSWPVVILHPLIVFGWFATVFVLLTRYPRRALVWIYGVSAVFVGLALVVWGFFSPGFIG
jgi:hypothetical protein